MLATGRPVSVSWLQLPNDHDRAALLEYTRGVLYGLAHSREQRAESRAIHASRIRGAFVNLGAPSLYRVGLKLLQILREAELLFGGYWLLTPFRVVEIESQFAFVGGVPLASGRLGEVTCRGLGRFISPRIADLFPRQTLESWMGVRRTSTTEQIANFVSNHRQHTSPTIDSGEIEYCDVARSGTAEARLAWTRQPHAVLHEEGIALCRKKHLGIYRYFSGDLRKAQLLTEAPVPGYPARLLFALAEAAGAPARVRVNHEGDHTQISVHDRLPAEEYRLALILASSASRAGATTTYSVENSLAPALLKQLSGLGCSVETSK